MITTRTKLAQRMLQDLQLLGHGERTQEAYLRAVRQLANYFGVSPERLTEPQLRDYFLYLKNDKKFAAGSLDTAIPPSSFQTNYDRTPEFPHSNNTSRLRRNNQYPNPCSFHQPQRAFLNRGLDTPLEDSRDLIIKLLCVICGAI